MVAQTQRQLDATHPMRGLHLQPGLESARRVSTETSEYLGNAPLLGCYPRHLFRTGTIPDRTALTVSTPIMG